MAELDSQSCTDFNHITEYLLYRSILPTGGWKYSPYCALPFHRWCCEQLPLFYSQKGAKFKLLFGVWNRIFCLMCDFINQFIYENKPKNTFNIRQNSNNIWNDKTVIIIMKMAQLRFFKYNQQVSVRKLLYYILIKLKANK